MNFFSIKSFTLAMGLFASILTFPVHAWGEADMQIPFTSTQTKEDLPLGKLNGQILFQVLCAELEQQRGRPILAYQTYLDLLKTVHDPRLARRATEIALNAQSSTNALVSAKLWHQYAPHSEQAMQVTAALLVLAGQLDEAQPILETALAKIPKANRAQAILALQQLIARAPNPYQGLQLLQTLLRKDRSRAETHLAIARQQLKADQPIAARLSLKEALSLKPNLEPAALLLAQLGKSQQQEAIQILKDYVRKNPTSHATRLVLAQLYIASEQFEAARGELRIYAKHNPNDLIPFMALGLIDMRQKHYSCAQRYFEQGLHIAQKDSQLSIDRAQICLYLAQIKLEQKNHLAAQQWLKALDKIDESFPLPLAIQVERIRMLAKIGQIDTANQLLSQLVGQTPQEQALITLTNSAILFEAHRYAEAEKQLTQIYPIFANDPNFLYDYAMLAEKNKHYDLMEHMLHQLIALKPNHPNGYNALGFSLADRNLRLAEANTLLEKASHLAPNDPFVMDSLGWVKYRLGQTKLALKILNRAYTLSPNVETAAHLGEVLWILGQQAKAKEIWRKAYQLDPKNETLQQTLQHFHIQLP
jgi:tetratricopeptide (TPR) repeat protein